MPTSPAFRKPTSPWAGQKRCEHQAQLSPGLSPTTAQMPSRPVARRYPSQGPSVRSRRHSQDVYDRQTPRRAPHTHAEKTKREGKNREPRPAVPDDQRGPAFPPAVFLAEGNKRAFPIHSPPHPEPAAATTYLVLLRFPALHHLGR
jgi:hypothetical protein